jgi:hypothetical protein
MFWVDHLEKLNVFTDTKTSQEFAAFLTQEMEQELIQSPLHTVLISRSSSSKIECYGDIGRPLSYVKHLLLRSYIGDLFVHWRKRCFCDPLERVFLKMKITDVPPSTAFTQTNMISVITGRSALYPEYSTIWHIDW